MSEPSKPKVAHGYSVMSSNYKLHCITHDSSGCPYLRLPLHTGPLRQTARQQPRMRPQTVAFSSHPAAHKGGHWPACSLPDVCTPADAQETALSAHARPWHGFACVRRRVRATWNSISHTGVARRNQLMNLRVWRAQDDPRRACSSRAAARAPVTASAVGAVSERLEQPNSAAASSTLRRALQLSLSARLLCSVIMRFI